MLGQLFIELSCRDYLFKWHALNCCFYLYMVITMCQHATEVQPQGNGYCFGIHRCYLLCGCLSCLLEMDKGFRCCYLADCPSNLFFTVDLQSVIHFYFLKHWIQEIVKLLFQRLHHHCDFIYKTYKANIYPLRQSFYKSTLLP